MIRSFLILFGLLFLPSPASTVEILYSNDVQGEIEPCGCRKNPAGGFARKETWIKTLGKHSRIQTDSGDLFFSSQVIPELLHDQAKLQAMAVVESMNVLGHDLFTPGEKDFTLGLDFFQTLRSLAKFKFISANLVKNDGTLLLEPNTIIGKVGFFGITGSDLKLPSGLQVKSPLDSAREQVGLLKAKGVEWIVALTHQGLESDQVLAKSIQEIDIILGAHTQSFLQNPLSEGKTQIFQSSYRNQHIGRITLKDHAQNKEISHELVLLDDRYEPKKSPVKQISKNLNKAIAKLNSKAATDSQPVNHSQRFQTFVACLDCHSTQVDFWKKTGHARALHPITVVSEARNKECLGCHSVGLGLPGGFESPMNVAKLRTNPNQSISPEELNPVLNEFVGFKPASQPKVVRRKITEFSHSYAPVQCENCHGPSNQHPFEPGFKKSPITYATCLNCHVPSRSPGWYSDKGEPIIPMIETLIAKTRCPKSH